ncbi:hypothetical protein NBZ79_07165 [Sneathiella marina]|uniref:Uncharacterized protein n=1 Tax=Sneathiella marina TaxID=2950108 RepID=A0ABY4WDQ8_9PROT|nr:hypothetical protein [Sneathiella marina]USG62756.1 hypothetical protein NBZ79_07165 [Sneathiella marina]
MSKSLRERAEDTAKEVREILGVSEDDHPTEVADAIEHAIIRALIEERDRCADMIHDHMEEDAQKAKYVSDKVRAVKSVLITNLSSMR